MSEMHIFVFHIKQLSILALKLNYSSYGSFIKDDFFLKTFQNHNLQYVYRTKSSHIQYAINIHVY